MISLAGHHALIPAAGSGLRLKGLAGDRPKSLVEVGGRPILTRGLGALASHGCPRVTLVVGHRGDCIRQAVGTSYRGMAVDYVESVDHATTEHGWSLFLTRDAWAETRRPVVFVDADNVYDARMLERLLADPRADLVGVDPGLVAVDRDEELVLGRDGTVTGLVRGRTPGLTDCAGGFVGVNRFSVAYMERLYAFMHDLFAARGRGFKYERVFDLALREAGAALGYVDLGGLAWVNVNDASDLARARTITAADASRPG